MTPSTQKQNSGTSSKTSVDCADPSYRESVLSKRREAWRNNPAIRADRKARHRAFVEKNPDYNKDYKCKTKWGFTRREKQERVTAQGGCCGNPGCHTSDPGVRGWCTDHNTQQIRGELCTQCNAALGLLKENAERISGLIKYLKQYEVEN